MEPFIFNGLPELPSEATSRAPRDKGERLAEISRILPRLLALIDEHRRAAQGLQIRLTAPDVIAVIERLRAHARKNEVSPAASSRDEVHDYVLHRLFEELVEEPSNILFTTKTGPDSLRYDSMETAFWLECLDALEKSINGSAKYKA